MDIAEACTTVHQWQEVFALGVTASSGPKASPRKALIAGGMMKP